MNNGADENLTTQNGAVNEQNDLPELEIDGVTFVRDQDNDYGTRWKVFDSVSWEEAKHGADEYGTLENTGYGFLELRPNIACFYPLSGSVLQVIVTFINQQ